MGLFLLFFAGTWVVFIILIAPFTQGYQSHSTFMAFFFFLTNLTLLIATATTEPGIIPSKRLPGISPKCIKNSMTSYLVSNGVD